MDLTSKYRTRHPPKEHEEAVRMLLEGIANANVNSRQASEMKTTSNHNYAGNYHSNTTVDSDEEDDVLVGGSQVEQPTPIHPLIDAALVRSKSISKATSTSCDDDEDLESMASNNDNNHGPMYKEPVPSRTIAVQCDLKSSAHKCDHLFNASMQASSISSTRYGFYSYTPEVLENRRKLQRSISSRNINSDRQQMEAPTSMSELSGSENGLGSDDELRTISSRLDQSVDKRPSDGENPEQSQTARARINSLPRRPMTAMSYVSSSRLRGDQSALKSRSQNRLGAASRTMSQQTLVRARTPAPPEPTSSVSNSDSELDQAHQLRHQRHQVPHSEELLVTRRGLSVPSKPPRPTLAAAPVSASTLSNTKTRNYRTLERAPTRESSTERLTSRLVVGPTSVTRRTVTSDLYQPQGERQQTQTVSRRPSAISRRSAYKRDDDEDNENRLPYASSNSVRPSNFDSNAHQSSSEQSSDAQYHRPGSHSSSMSLSRRPKVVRPFNSNDMEQPTSNYCTTSRSNRKLNRHDRAYSQSQLTKPTLYVPSPIANPLINSNEQRRHHEHGVDMSRWNSMRHIDKSDHNQRPLPSQRQQNYLIAQEFELKQQQALEKPTSKNIFTSASKFDQRHYDYGEEEEEEEVDEDSESSITKTWANPSQHKSQLGRTIGSVDQNTRKSTRSYNARSNDNYHEDYSYGTLQHQHRQKADQSSYNSSSESSVLDTVQHQHRFNYNTRQAQPLQHHDSQQRLNEIGLPEVNLTSRRQEPHESAQSYLGISSDHHLRSRASHHTAELGLLAPKPGQITGRAMSQQSLTRPTMPPRRRGASNSGSDVGGSSMSLVSRLQGRYENAHTRSPVIMYIPQASTNTSRSSVLGADGATIGHKSNTLRKSSRSRQKSSSQDRSRRSLSRNNSDSESSSMLRTLIRPRGSRLQGQYASKRSRTVADHHHDHDEDVDGVGQLATEVDSYKFRRRYSVPKDAKINWFAKLKQRVSSSGGK